MKFSKVIGKCDAQLVLEAERSLTATFTELALGYKVRTFGSRLGGDIFIHQMISIPKHICDARALEYDEGVKRIELEYKQGNITEQEKQQIVEELRAMLGGKLLTTASTSGKTYNWNPQFIVKQSPIGLRLIVGHEAWHSIYLHPQRRGSRNPALYNIIVDFKVNNTLMQDLKARGIYRPDEMFRQELGDFITVKDYIEFLKDPFNARGKLAKWNPIHTIQQLLNPPKETEHEITHLYYAEPNLSDELKRPENLYAYVLKHIPKCKTCGKLGVWSKPNEFKKLEKQLAEMQNKQANECSH